VFAGKFFLELAVPQHTRRDGLVVVVEGGEPKIIHDGAVSEVLVFEGDWYYRLADVRRSRCLSGSTLSRVFRTDSLPWTARHWAPRSERTGSTFTCSDRGAEILTSLPND